MNVTSDDIEFRVCMDETAESEDIYIQLLDLYIR